MATNLAKSKLFKARVLYKTMLQKLKTLKTALIRRDAASDIVVCVCVWGGGAPVGWWPRASGTAGCFPEETDGDTSLSCPWPASACLPPSSPEQQREVRRLCVPATAAATRSDQILTRYRVADVELLPDHPRVIDGARILFSYFDNNVLIHGPPAR